VHWLVKTLFTHTEMHDTKPDSCACQGGASRKPLARRGDSWVPCLHDHFLSIPCPPCYGGPPLLLWCFVWTETWQEHVFTFKKDTHKVSMHLVQSTRTYGLDSVSKP